MKLPHFDLVYDANHQELANLYADRLEDNLQFLSKYFEIFPERTVVVLNDRTDLTNGYATAIPYRTIMIYPVLPGPQETISDYGDWARELLMHEYTHILSFEPRRGLIKGLYSTFGNIITPNLLLPRWWLEGIAVDLETRTSEKGRLRSPYQDGAIRAYVKEQKLRLIDLAEINETSIHTWPQGSRPYLFGSLLWSDLISRHGQKLISELHLAYGGRIPFVIETPVLERTGGRYRDQFEMAKFELQTRAEKQLQTLSQVPFTEGSTLIVKNGVENFQPVISPDGLKMIFLSKSDSNKRSVRILVRPSVDVAFDGSQEIAEIKQRLGETAPEQIPTPRHDFHDAPPGGTIQRLAWFPDSTKIVFDKLDTINRYQEASDLHVFDLNTMKIERLTRAERAREASVSPDSTAIAFVKLDAGRTHLALWDLSAQKSRVVYSPPLQARISSPTFISSNEIVFSERFDGREVLKKLALGDLQIQEILTQYPDARFPQWTASGLLFTSSQNGTGNLYLASTELKTARPLTHSGTYVSTGAWDEKRQDVYFSELTTHGYQIRSLASGMKLSAELPRIEPLLADRYPVEKHTVPETAKPEPTDYTIWPYILPHYWLPNLYVYSGGALIGASTSGADPLAKHSYSLDFSYDTEPQEMNLGFLYANNSTAATLQLKAFDYHTRILNTAYEFRQQLYEADALWEISELSPYLLAGIGYRGILRTFALPADLRTESSGPTLLARYSDTAMSGAQISPESGQSLYFASTHFLQGSSEQEEFNLYELSLQKFYSANWLPRHHAVMLRAQGQFIDRSVNAANSAITVAFNSFSNDLAPTYLMRGYLNGQFLGRSLANYTLEYRFPISYPYRGFDSLPFFIKRVHGALVADAATVDGFAFNLGLGRYERVDSWKSFWSAGAELKFDLTLGYHIPITFYLGAYMPQDSRYKDGQQFALGLQL